jgi:hypothetical protein
VARDYSKENTNGYPSIIHKALTLTNEYKLLKVDTKKRKQPKKCKLRTKYLIAEQNEWNALSPEAQSKIIEACKKSNNDDEDDKSLASNKSEKTIKSISKMMKSLEKNNQR